MSPDQPERWLERALSRCWPGARLTELRPLAGDASVRRYWRALLAPAMSGVPPSAIVADLGPHDLPRYARELRLVAEPLPEPPLLNVHRFLTAVGAAVPAIYLAAPQERLLLIEDLGDCSLYAAVSQQPDNAGALFHLALDELLNFHITATRRPDPACIAFGLAYDERLFQWEMEQFLAHGVAQVAPAANPEDLRPEIAHLAGLLGALPRVFSHRDYHYRNLMVQDGAAGPRIRVIDFQDALMAPAAQDLAVLLTTRETAEFIAPRLEQQLIAYYLEHARQADAMPLDDLSFLRSYYWCVLQHALKVIGLFAYLEDHGKPGYRIYQPIALAQARRILAMTDEFPALRRALSGE